MQSPYHPPRIRLSRLGTVIAESIRRLIEILCPTSCFMRSSVRKPTPQQQNRRKRSGVVTLEFIIVAPVVFIAVIAIFEFGFLALTLQVGHTALIEGTRRGAELYPDMYPLDLAGPDNDIADQIVEVMNAHLNVQCLEIYDSTQGFTDNPNRANAQIIIERNEMTAVTRGDAVNFPAGFVCTPMGPPPSVNEIRVTLCFPIVDATDPTGYGNPVPDWLSRYGMSLAGCVFEVSSRMTLE